MIDINGARTIGELVRVTSLTDPMIRRRLRSGEIAGIRAGVNWLIPIGEVERLRRKYPLTRESHV